VGGDPIQNGRVTVYTGALGLTFDEPHTRAARLVHERGNGLAPATDGPANLLGIQQFYAESSGSLPPGEHQVRMEFAYAGGGLGKGGTVSLYVDGKKVGEGKVGATAAMIFSADDGCDVGVDTGSPVSPDYGSRGNEFDGTVKGVQLAIADAAEGVDHLVSPAEAVRVAAARQ
jgi:hypothetical protein